MSQQINLLNPLLKRQRDYFSFPNMLQALGFVVSGSLLFYGYAFYQASQLDKQFEESTQRYNTEQTRLALFTKEFSPQLTKETLQAEVSRLEKERDGQKELIETLKTSAGGNTTGFSEYMRAFSRQVVQGLWLTSFKVSGDGMEISLNGAVLNPELLPAYVQRLGKEKIMQGKTFSTLQMKQHALTAGAEPISEKTLHIPSTYVEFMLYSAPGSEARK